MRMSLPRHFAQLIHCVRGRGNLLRVLHVRPRTNCRRLIAVLNHYTQYRTLKQLNAPDSTLQSDLVARSENDHVFKVFRELKNYEETFFNSSNVPKTSLSPVLQNFMEIASSSDIEPISSDTYADFLMRLDNNIPKLSDNELATILHQLQLFPKCSSAMDKRFYTLWKKLDEECVSRMSTWSLNFAFQIDNLWYDIFLSRLCNFHWQLKRKLFRKCDRMTKEQYIRFMFHLNIGRVIPKMIKTHDMECKLNSIVDDLSIEEIVIVAIGFFKTETRIQDATLLEKILRKALDRSEKLDSVQVACVAKLARHSSVHKHGLVDFLYSFQEKFVPEIARLSITACTQLALVGSYLQNPHIGLLKKVAEKMETTIDETRLKEMERVVFAIATYNVDCDSLCNKIVEQIRHPSRADEINQYGRCVPSILYYLMLRGIFPLDLISKVLSPRYMELHFGKTNKIYQRELVSLEMTMSIEVPDYKGPFLDDAVRLQILEVNNLWLKPNAGMKQTKYGNISNEVATTLAELIGGSKYLISVNILPQYHTVQVIFCSDKENQFVLPPVWLKETKDFEPKYIPNSPDSTRLVYHALFIISRGMSFGRTGDLLGHTLLQLRQLRKLGYIVYEMQAEKWTQIEDAFLQKKWLFDTIMKTSPHLKLQMKHEYDECTADLEAAVTNVKIKTNHLI